MLLPVSLVHYCSIRPGPDTAADNCRHGMVDNPDVLHIQVSRFRDFAKEFFEQMSDSRFCCSTPSLLIISVRVQTVSRSFEEMEIMFGSGETGIDIEAGATIQMCQRMAKIRLLRLLQ